MRFVKSSLFAAATAAALLLLGTAQAGPAAAANDCGISHPVSDFNGDGYADAVVGDPNATVDGRTSAGKVTVLYGSASGIGLSASRATLTEGLFSFAGDHYGTVVKVGYVDGDSCADLVVSAPDATPSAASFEKSGVVYVVYGSVNGLGEGKATLPMGPPYADNTLVQGSLHVAGTAEAGDRFGASLAVDFDIFDHAEEWLVAIGAPGEAIGSRANAGAVVIYAGPFISQDTAGVAGVAEAGDHFGATLAFAPMNGAMQLAVGVPREDIGSIKDAGGVQTFSIGTGKPGDSDHWLDQNTDGIAGAPQSGDHFGAALSAAGAWDAGQILLIGTPDDAVFTRGVVHAISWQKILTGSGVAYTFAPGHGGVPSDAVRFGASVAAASTRHDV